VNGADEITLDGIRDLKIFQHREGYRFSVDPLLLYSFVGVKYAKQIVDLGAGSGIIGLLLARKYEHSKVLLMELQERLCRLAERNVSINDLQDRVSVRFSDINHVKDAMPPESYDLAVSNPPFRTPVSGRISEGEEKALARHEIKLTLKGLVESASYLLRARGRFFMIYHPERIVEVVDALRGNRLEPKRLRFVHNDIGAVSKIMLLEAVKDGKAGLQIERPLVLYEKGGEYTEELKRMYGG
jgi:tRNA1Val (adenine37-N6)-methyltransferase